jgi:hypothetical protein
MYNLIHIISATRDSIIVLIHHFTWHTIMQLKLNTVFHKSFYF